MADGLSKFKAILARMNASSSNHTPPQPPPASHLPQPPTFPSPSSLPPPSSFSAPPAAARKVSGECFRTKLKKATIRSWEWIAKKDRGEIIVKESRESTGKRSNLYNNKKRGNSDLEGIGYTPLTTKSDENCGKRKANKSNKKRKGSSINNKGDGGFAGSPDGPELRLYVSNIPTSLPSATVGKLRSITPSDVVSYFGGNGVVGKVKLYRDSIRGNVLKGDCLVRFRDVGGWRRGLEMNGKVWGGRALKVMEPEWKGRGGDVKCLKIWNLYSDKDVPVDGLARSSYMSDLTNDITSECSKFGVVKGLEFGGTLGVEVDGGCVTVEFEDVEGARKAAKGLRGRYFEGRIVAVEWTGEEGEEQEEEAVVAGKDDEEETVVDEENIRKEEARLDDFFSSLL